MMALLTAVVICLALSLAAVGAGEGRRRGALRRFVPGSTSHPPPDPDIFREILHKANSLEGLVDDNGGIFIEQDIALTHEGMRNAFNGSQAKVVKRDNRTFHVPSTKLRRDRVMSPRRRATVRGRRLRGGFIVTPKRSVPLRMTRRRLAVERSKVHAGGRGTPWRVFTAYAHHRQVTRAAEPSKSYHSEDHHLTGSKKSHLQLSDWIAERRFGNMNIEVYMASARSPSRFVVPQVDAAFRKATIYKTPLQNSSLELFCLVAYKKTASIVWRIGERQPEEYVVTQVAYTERDGLKIMISRLWVPRLEILPTTSTGLTLHCIVKADDADARSSVQVPGSFNDSCFDGADCEPRNAVCAFGKCECMDFMPVRLRSKHTTCRSFGYVGWPCHYDEQCLYAVQNSLCSAKGKCVCQKDYRRDRSNVSCVHKHKLGAGCADHSECAEVKAACVRGHCRCAEGRSARAGICYKLPPLPTPLDRSQSKMELNGNETNDIGSSENITGALGAVGLGAAHSRAAGLPWFLEGTYGLLSAVLSKCVIHLHLYQLWNKL